MRKCLRCGAEMIEGMELKQFASIEPLTLTMSDKAFSKRLGPVKWQVAHGVENFHFIQKTSRN